MDRRPDEEILDAYRRGEAGGLAVLIRRHHDDLMRFLVRLVGDRAGAEDVFQETFLQVHTSADSFDASRRFKPWLFTIAANKARDLLRRNQRRRTLDLSAPIGGPSRDGGEGSTFVDLMQLDGPSPAENLSVSERDRLVQQAVSEVPPTLREVLLLAYFQRLSYNQIADALGIPLGTVKSRLHAAVGAFARRWEAVSGAASPKSAEPTPRGGPRSDNAPTG
jgi:RNA polymerase sigma-70 factor (ECF subfamily)